MINPLSVTSSVVIGDGCPMRCYVNCSAETEFHCGGPSGGVELTFQADALREFLRLGMAALQEMEARFAREQAVLAKAG
jgi:hypothetical protein